MANHVSHGALEYPVKGARYSLLIPYLDADGDPTDPTTPDTEISKDAGAFADCAEEASVITGSNGSACITLTGAETDCSLAMLCAKIASGPKPTLAVIKPRVLPTIYSGTAQAGASSTITLATDVPAVAGLLLGCVVKTTGGTGGGGTGGANNQARRIVGFTTGRVATVEPAWETAPDNTTTYEIKHTPESFLKYADVRLCLGTAQGTTLDTIDSRIDSEVALIYIDTQAIKAAVDTEVAAIKAKTDNLPTDPADASDIAAAIATLQAFVDTEVAAIKAKTDNLPSDPADASDIAAAIAAVHAFVDTEVAAIKAKTDNLPADPADASDIASAIATLQAFVDTEVAAIKAKTDNLPANPASQTKLDTIYDQMTEDDGGVRRFTTNALEQAPGGAASTPERLVNTTVASLTNQTVFRLTAGPTNDDALNGQTIVLFDASVSNNPSVRKILDYVGSTKEVTIDGGAAFTLVAGDGVMVFVAPAGASAPTEAQVADKVLDELAKQKQEFDRATGTLKSFKPDGTTVRGTLQLTETGAGKVAMVSV